MAVRWLVGLVSGLAFVIGLAYQEFVLAFGGLLGLLGAVVVVRPGKDPPVRPVRNPLAEAYRDVVDRHQGW